MDDALQEYGDCSHLPQASEQGSSAADWTIQAFCISRHHIGLYWSTPASGCLSRDFAASGSRSSHALAASLPLACCKRPSPQSSLTSSNLDQPDRPVARLRSTAPKSPARRPDLAVSLFSWFEGSLDSLETWNEWTERWSGRAGDADGLGRLMLDSSDEEDWRGNSIERSCKEGSNGHEQD